MRQKYVPQKPDANGGHQSTRSPHAVGTGEGGTVGAGVGFCVGSGVGMLVGEGVDMHADCAGLENWWPRRKDKRAMVMKTKMWIFLYLLDTGQEGSVRE